MARPGSFEVNDDNNAAVANDIPNFTEINERMPAGGIKVAAMDAKFGPEPTFVNDTQQAPTEQFEMPKPDPEAIRRVEALASGLSNALRDNMTPAEAGAAIKQYMNRKDASGQTNMDKFFMHAADAYPELPFQGMVSAINKAISSKGYSASIQQRGDSMEGDLVIKKGNTKVYQG